MKLIFGILTPAVLRLSSRPQRITLLTLLASLFFTPLLLLPRRCDAALQLYGVNYSLRKGPDWEGDVAKRCKSYDQVVAELNQLRSVITERVRVFSMTDCDTTAIMLRATQQVNMKVWLGLWVGEDPVIFEQERNRMLQLLALPSEFDFSNVIGLHVSSEAIYRQEITVDQAIAYRNTIKDDLIAAGLSQIPVTVADIIDNYIAYPQLIQVDPSVITFNQFPFWERTVDINGAAEYMSTRIANIENQAEGRTIIVTETGWADAGENKNANIASPASMVKWLRDFVCLATERGWQHFWFTSFDSDWRRVNENKPDDVEGHFGLFTQDGALKPYIRDLEIDCTKGRTNIDPNQPVPTQPPSSSNTTTRENSPTYSPTAFPSRTPTTTTPTMKPTILVVTTDNTDSPSSVAPVPDPEPTVSPANDAESPTVAPITTAPSPPEAVLPSRQPTIARLETPAPSKQLSPTTVNETVSPSTSTTTAAPSSSAEPSTEQPVIVVPTTVAPTTASPSLVPTKSPMLLNSEPPSTTPSQEPIETERPSFPPTVAEDLPTTLSTTTTEPSSPVDNEAPSGGGDSSSSMRRHDKKFASIVIVVAILLLTVCLQWTVVF